MTDRYLTLQTLDRICQVHLTSFFQKDSHALKGMLKASFARKGKVPMKRIIHLFSLSVVSSFCCGPIDSMDDPENFQKEDPRTQTESEEELPNKLTQEQLVQSALEKMPWLEKDPACRGSTGENPMPDGYCDPTIDYEANNRRLTKKLEELETNPIAKQILSASYDVRLKGPYRLVKLPTTEAPDDSIVSDYKFRSTQRSSPRFFGMLQPVLDQKSYLPTFLNEFPLFTQQCKNWCGPAAVQMVLHYLGLENSQKNIAEALGTGECDEGVGTAITPILNYLNKQIQEVNAFKDVMTLAGQTCKTYEDPLLKESPYTADRIGPDTPNNAIRLIERVIQDVTLHNQPVVALINQTPRKRKYRFPNFTYIGDRNHPDELRGHYIVLIGYRGGYIGEDRSAEFIFRESSGRNIENEIVDVNTVVADLESNNGHGGMAKSRWNVIW